MQLDAAVNEGVRKSKYKGETFTGEANVLVFPDLGAGNIGYKIAQRFGGFGAIGPIITGVKKPVNDLSQRKLDWWRCQYCINYCNSSKQQGVVYE